MKVTVVESVKTGIDYIFDLEVKRLFRKPHQMQVIGSCTVWYKLPEWERCNSTLESALSVLYQEREAGINVG